MELFFQSHHQANAETHRGMNLPLIKNSPFSKEILQQYPLLSIFFLLQLLLTLYQNQCLRLLRPHYHNQNFDYFSLLINLKQDEQNPRSSERFAFVQDQVTLNQKDSLGD